LLELAGIPLLSHVVDRLTPQVSGLVLNANGNPERFAKFGLPVVADSIGGFAGPLAGVLAGMDYAATQGSSHIVTAAADTPFFPHDLVSRLVEGAKASSSGMAMAATDTPPRGVSRHPTFALWPVALREDLRQALRDGTRKVVLWTDRHDCVNVLFEGSGIDPFFNVNTPEDMTRAEQILQEYDI
jgi:molybdopterin-guanine dinucleotide biosynthesis protein A